MWIDEPVILNTESNEETYRLYIAFDKHNNILGISKHYGPLSERLDYYDIRYIEFTEFDAPTIYELIHNSKEF